MLQRKGFNVVLLAALFLSLSVSGATAALITFDDGSAGDSIGSFYAAQGVTFSNAQWNAPIYNQDGTPSSGIFLVDSTAGWNPPWSPTVASPIVGVFSSAVSSLSLLAVDVGSNGIRLDAYDSAVGGTLVGFDSFTGVGAGVGTYYNLTVADASIRRFEVYLLAQVPGDGIFFDNLRFTESAPVPEPGTMLLLGSGLMGLVGYGRRKMRK